MEGFKQIIQRGDDDAPINLLELRDYLNSKSEEELKNSDQLWFVVNEVGEIPNFTIRSIMEATEDHINGGDGAYPASLYYGDNFPEEDEQEDIEIKRGSIILLIDSNHHIFEDK